MVDTSRLFYEHQIEDGKESFQFNGPWPLCQVVSDIVFSSATATKMYLHETGMKSFDSDDFFPDDYFPMPRYEIAPLKILIYSDDFYLFIKTCTMPLRARRRDLF